MQSKIFLFLICLLASTILGANTPPVQPITAIPQYVGGPECDLPAPFNFKIDAIGSTWVTLSWGGNATAQHRIRIYRVSDNALLSTDIIAAGVANATIAIPFNTPVKAVINAICASGIHSPHIAETDTFNGLIIDVVVTGYNGSNSSPSCPMVGPGTYTCTFGNTGYTTFKMTMNGQNPKYFDVQPTTQGERFPKFVIHPQDGNSGNNDTYSFYCTSSQSPDCPSYKIIITYWQNGNQMTVGTLKGSQATGSYTTVNSLTASELYYVNPSTNFKIERLGTGFAPDPPKEFNRGNDRNSDTHQPATISPNPFNDQLDVFLSPTAEKVQLQLYNFSGQKVLDQQFSGGSEVYSLSTANLATGFYLLRIDADGDVQTLKVIKSE